MHESTKHTPFYSMHGREARLPLQVEKSGVSTSPTSNVQEKIEHTLQHMASLKESVYPAALENIEKAQQKQKEQYRARKGIKQSNIKEGDIVLRLNMKKRTKKGHKGEDSWLGPYKVFEITKYGSATLGCVKTNMALSRKVNIGQLKRYNKDEADSTTERATGYSS